MTAASATAGAARRTSTGDRLCTDAGATVATAASSMGVGPSGECAPHATLALEDALPIG